jgi:hypothetical protein
VKSELKSDYTVVIDARAALRGEIERALVLVSAKRSLDDEDIHKVRQALKQARAALRLLRDAVTDADFRRENRSLRDAARPLASARDLAVMLQLVEGLMAARKLRRYRSLLAALRLRLRASHAERMALVRTARITCALRAHLEQSLERTAHWRLPGDPRRVYRAGVLRIYARGRDDLHVALARDSAAALHEWRKQAKYLGAALALLACDRAKAKAANEIARRLGDDHDLALLGGRLGRSAEGRALKARLEKKRRKLQKRAVKLARRLYKPSPERFAAALRGI